MADVEKTFLDHLGSHGTSWGWVFVILISEIRELIKALLFSHRRKKDKAQHERWKCRLADPEQDDKFECKLDADLRKDIRNTAFRSRGK